MQEYLPFYKINELIQIYKCEQEYFVLMHFPGLSESVWQEQMKQIFRCDHKH